jgi:endoglucanase
MNPGLKFILFIILLFVVSLYNYLLIKIKHFYAGTHKKWLRDRTDEAVKKRLPIFISECSAIEASGDGPLNYNEWKVFVEWMDKKN